LAKNILGPDVETIKGKITRRKQFQLLIKYLKYYQSLDEILYCQQFKISYENFKTLLSSDFSYHAAIEDVLKSNQRPDKVK